MPETIVQLSRTYENPFDGTRFNSVTLREPTYRDVFADGMGPPVEAQPTSQGGVMVITHHDLIARYIDRLAIKPTSENFSMLSAVDALRLGKAVTDFFTGPAAPDTPPAGSSSAPASLPT